MFEEKIGLTIRVIIILMNLSNEQLERYCRQMILPGIGGAGQEKLLKSKVLVVGAGGLGSPVLTYLARAGVGTIGIMDFDKVDLSNLHRQIIHNTLDLDKPKVISAKEKLSKINPDVKVLTCETKLDVSNVEGIFKDFDIVVDGVDNFNDKFLINDHCVSLNKKLVHAGVIGFEGQILTVIPGRSACLRCYFPDGAPRDLRQSCKEAGVFSTCVGVISTIQANEVLKLILEIGKPLCDRVLKFNSLDGTFYEFKSKGKNKNCMVCGKKTKVHSLR